MDPVQHQDVFLKDLLALSGILNRFSVKMYFLLKSPTGILKSTPQRWHASELAGFAACFGVREEFFRPTFIRLNLVTALNRFCEHSSLEDIHNCTEYKYHIFLI